MGDRRTKRPGLPSHADAAEGAKESGEPETNGVGRDSAGRGNSVGERAGVSRGHSRRPKRAGKDPDGLTPPKARTSSHREEP